MPEYTIGQKTAELLGGLLTPSIANYSKSSGAVQLDGPSLERALATLPASERAEFVTYASELTAGGVALIGDASAPFAAPWVALGYAAQQSESGALEVARLLGVPAGTADVASAIRAAHPNVPSSFLNNQTVAALASAKPVPAPRISPGDIEAVAECLEHADYSGLEGRGYLAPLGFSITLDQDCASKVATLLVGAGGGTAIVQAVKKAASSGVSAALSAVAASAATVLELIAAALGENINLVNGPNGCRIECTWPYTGGFFFWADSVGSPAPAVAWTAPDVNASVGGAVQLSAQGVGVAAIDFSASYASNPSDTSTIAWHALGRGTSGQANTWSLTWDSSTVPTQSDPGRGLVNLCAIGVDDDGNELGQDVRDYRLSGIHNALRMECTTTPPVVQTGKQVSVTVNAVDLLTNAKLSGSVSINGQVVGSLGQPFTYSFMPHATSIKQPVYAKNSAGKPVPAGFKTTTTTTYPTGSVSVAGYQPGSVTFGLHTTVATTVPSLKP